MRHVRLEEALTALLGWILIIAAIFIALWIYAGYKKGLDEYADIADGFTDTADPQEADGQELPEDAPERLSIDWDRLETQYPGIIGWLTLPAAEISYPVMQAEDNDYYMHRDPAGDSLYAGSIFMDCSCGKDISNLNTVVYGHNMRNGSMFGKLKKYNDTDVLGSCPYFWYYTPEQDYLLRIFSVHVVSATGNAYLITFEDSGAYADWVSDMLAGSDIDTGVDAVPEGSRVMTLSTCSNHYSSREVVQGYILWQGLPAESEG
ncbi:MAG: class B sortase [Lachnospiraceae bacterium]|nr:class B sortase [Lachnospiraceae bacterium]